MSIVITIGGVDKTESVIPETFSLDRALTSQVDTFKFRVIYNPLDTYKPDLLDTILIEQDGTVLFGGQIVEINEIVEGADVQLVDCQAKDYAFDMDRMMVVGTWSDTSVNDIIADIAADFLDPAYDITNVDCPLVLSYFASNYEYPSKIFQQLAEIAGYDWYVNSLKEVYFFSNFENPAPFNLTDDNGMYYYNSLKIRKDVKNLRNDIVVRGGEYQGSLSSETQDADGLKLIYNQGERYANIYVKVATVSKTVGIDNIHDPASYDCLYNFQEKFIRFKAGTIPTAGQDVEVGGNPYRPVIVNLDDVASVAEFGHFQSKVIDKSILTKEGARERARAEINAWAAALNEGSFETVQSGLEVGQRINIQSTIRDLDIDCIISKITTKMTSGTAFVHLVTLVTVKTYGIIEFLQKQLIAKDKEIEITPGETVDRVTTANELITVDDGNAVTSSTSHNPMPETITVGESVTPQALNYAVEFVLNGGSAPSGTSRTFILDGSLLS